MATTINVLCYKSKTLKNGEHPLKLCICKDVFFTHKETPKVFCLNFWGHFILLIVFFLWVYLYDSYSISASSSFV